MIGKYPQTVARQEEMLEASEMLVEYMDISHDNQWLFVESQGCAC